MARSGLDLSLLLEAPAALEAGTKAVRVCPHRDAYPLVDWVLSPLPERCEREGAMLVLDFAPGSIPWTDVVTFARAFPTVPMVVLGAESNRVAAAALDATANLVLQGAGFESLAATVGAHRFVDGETAAALLSGEWGSMYL
jgi:hypothetical protein